MKVGEDDWCPYCKGWMLFDNEGNCKVCGRHINALSTDHGWFKTFGVELKELQNESADF